MKETEIWTVVSLEKSKSEIPLQIMLSKKYETELSNVDGNVVTYFTLNYENHICDNSIELWEKDYKKEKQTIKKIYHKTEEWCLTTFLQVSTILHKIWKLISPLNIPISYTKFEKFKTAETPEIFWMVETILIYTERRTIILAFAMKRTTNITWLNPQQTDHQKWEKRMACTG